MILIWHGLLQLNTQKLPISIKALSSEFMFTDRYGNAIREEVQENVEYEAGFTFLGKPVYYKLIPEFQISGTGSNTKNISSYISPQTIDQCWIDNSKSYIATLLDGHTDFTPVNNIGVNSEQTIWGYQTIIRKTDTVCNLICNIGTSEAGNKFYHVYVMYTKR